MRKRERGRERKKNNCTFMKRTEERVKEKKVSEEERNKVKKLEIEKD